MEVTRRKVIGQGSHHFLALLFGVLAMGCGGAPTGQNVGDDTGPPPPPPSPTATHTPNPTPIPEETPTPLALTVLSPNGGEHLLSGETSNLQWSSTDLTGVITIEYMAIGGDWTTIVADTENDGSYDWAVPFLDEFSAYEVKIRISCVNCTNDESDAPFAVIQPLPTPIPTPTPPPPPPNAPTLGLYADTECSCNQASISQEDRDSGATIAPVTMYIGIKGTSDYPDLTGAELKVNGIPLNWYGRYPPSATAVEGNSLGSPVDFHGGNFYADMCLPVPSPCRILYEVTMWVPVDAADVELTVGHKDPAINYTYACPLITQCDHNPDDGFELFTKICTEVSGLTVNPSIQTCTPAPAP